MRARYIWSDLYTNERGIIVTVYIPSNDNHIHNPTTNNPLASIPPKKKVAGVKLDPVLGFLVAVAVATPPREVTLAGVSAAELLAAAVGIAATAGPPQ